MINTSLKKKWRALFIATYLLAPLLGGAAQAANPCASFDGGIGGTGQVAQGDGIGGTGVTANGGIGGTGIVGVITGFGSICVNGIEIHYDVNTPVQVHRNAAHARQLAIGQVVAVEATGVGTEVRARRIEVVPAVIGPISEVDLTRGTMRVLGQNVRLTSETVRARANFKVGDPVQVSGLRAARGAIIATRIEPAARGVAAVTGPVGQPDARGFRIHGLSIETPATTGIEPGRVARVTGVWDGNRLRAEHVEMKPVIPFEGRVSALSIQGYVAAGTQGDRIRVGEVEVYLTRGTRIGGGSAADLNERRVHIRARVNADRHVVAERIDIERGMRDHRDGRDSGGQRGDKDRENSDGGRDDDSADRTEVHSRDSGRSDNSRSHDLRPERDHSDRLERMEPVERVERMERPDRSGHD